MTDLEFMEYIRSLQNMELHILKEKEDDIIRNIIKYNEEIRNIWHDFI